MGPQFQLFGTHHRAHLHTKAAKSMKTSVRDTHKAGAGVGEQGEYHRIGLSVHGSNQRTVFLHPRFSPPKQTDRRPVSCSSSSARSLRSSGSSPRSSVGIGFPAVIHDVGWHEKKVKEKEKKKEKKKEKEEEEEEEEEEENNTRHLQSYLRGQP